MGCKRMVHGAPAPTAGTHKPGESGETPLFSGGRAQGQPGTAEKIHAVRDRRDQPVGQHAADGTAVGEGLPGRAGAAGRPRCHGGAYGSLFPGSDGEKAPAEIL